MDLLFLGDINALHIMDVFPKYSILTRVRSKNPQEVWDAFLASWVGVFGAPKSLHPVERRIKPVLRGVGAHPWISGRRNGLARGIYNRLQADRYYAGAQILTEVQSCLNTLVSAGGYSAYQLVFGSNPTDLYSWDDSDDGRLFAQDTSISGQFAQQRQGRIRAQEAALAGVANSKLRRLLAYNKTFDCIDIKVGDSVLFYKAPQKKRNPRWRGSATILDNDECGVTMKSQSQYFKVARYCVRRKVEEKDLPQGSAAGENPMNLGWDMSQPLFAPPTQLDPPQIEEAPSDLNSAALPVNEAEKPSGVAPVDEGIGGHAGAPATASSSGGPVLMCLDSDGPVLGSSPSGGSWSELCECTCRDAATSDGSGSRGKRARPPEFVPEKRLKHDVLRTPFVSNKEVVKEY